MRAEASNINSNPGGKPRINFQLDNPLLYQMNTSDTAYLKRLLATVH